MPAVDFRATPFDAARLRQTGQYMGRTAYWRLYAAENVVRVVINSVLLVLIGPDWWLHAVAKPVRDQAERFRTRYRQRPWHTPQGNHGIYYVFLGELGDIIRDNSGAFLTYIPDIDQWIAKIEGVNLPRNVVGHMNYLSANDQARITLFYEDVSHLPAALIAAGVPIVIP